MPSFPETVGGWLLDLVGFIGLAMGGGQAAASGLLNEMQQDSFQQVASGQAPIGGLRGRVLSAEQLANMVVRDVLGHAEATGQAAYSGFNPENFDRMVSATGNPPGMAELIAMWRRRINSDDDIRMGLRQGNLKNEWIEHVLALRHDPLSVSEAVAAAVQGHLPYDDAATFADMGGVDRATFDVMFANAGNPPGPIEMLNLWVRGYVTEADVDQALRESRLKDKWIPALKKLAIRKVPLRSITQLLNAGAIDDATATRMLSELGYSPDDVQALLKSHKKAGTNGQKQLSVSVIESLYSQKLITRDVATVEIVAHGYSAADAAALLDFADSRWRVQLQARAVTRVRAAFLSRRIDKGEASNDLDVLQIPGDHRDALLDAWTVELSTAHSMLTAAQVLAADKHGVITAAEAHERLMGDGYSDRDATILQMLHGSVQVPPNPIGA